MHVLAILAQSIITYVRTYACTYVCIINPYTLYAVLHFQCAQGSLIMSSVTLTHNHSHDCYIRLLKQSNAASAD